MDIVFIIAMIIFFAACLGLIYFFDSLSGSER